MTGHADGGHDPAHLLEHGVEVECAAVRHAQRPRDAGARRGDGREADLLEDARRAGVPGVGEHEPGAVVEAEQRRGALGGHGDHARARRRQATSSWTKPTAASATLARSGYGAAAYTPSSTTHRRSASTLRVLDAPEARTPLDAAA